jgi:hypothetical protein
MSRDTFAGVTSIVAGIKSVLAGARTAVAIVKRIESSESLEAQLDRSDAEVRGEAAQVSYAICRALVAQALGRDPSHDQVNDVLSAAVNDPSFPNRAFRLLGEARKSASRRRRLFLASMLFGLPFTKLPDDERDRVDMVVERIMLPDVELLRLIVEKDRTAPPSPEPEPYLFRGTRVAALTRDLEVRVATTNEYMAGGTAFGDPTYEDEQFRVDHTAFSALLALGCIELAERKMTQGEWGVQALVVSPLGRLVAGAIEALRPGFDATP